MVCNLQLLVRFRYVNLNQVKKRVTCRYKPQYMMPVNQLLYSIHSIYYIVSGLKRFHIMTYDVII